MAASEQEDVVESILRRYKALEVTNKVLMTTTLGLATSTAVLALAVAFLALTKPEPRYFATTTKGQILPLVPLDKPHQSASEVSNFAVKAVTNALTYDFANYREDFSRDQEFFTKPSGWNEFVDAVQRSQMLDLVKEKRLNTTAVANRAVIVKEGVNVSGRYEWVVQMPIRITYQSASEITGQSFLVTVYIERLQTYESPYAMAISRFIAAPGGN